MAAALRPLLEWMGFPLLIFQSGIDPQNSKRRNPSIRSDSNGTFSRLNASGQSIASVK